MQIRHQILLTTVVILTICCNFKSEKTKVTTFYNNISDWDIDYIPIIDPFRASSIDNGITWILNNGDINSIRISEFGVSQNFIFGKGGNGWFLFDTKTKLYAEYNTQQELTRSLESLNVRATPTATCTSYFDSLANGKTCYWFPKEGQKYPDFPGVIPIETTPITITETANNHPDFKFNQQLKYRENKIYYFKITYNKPNNDLYYLSFDNSRPILITDSLIIPFFTNKQEFDISVYTPFPVAQEKGIPESKRFLKSKVAYIR